MIRKFGDKRPRIKSNAYIDEMASIIGDVEIGSDSSIWPMAVLRGDINSIKIGARTSIQDGTVIHVTHAGDFNPKGFSTEVGDDVIVGHRAVLHGCKIANHCLIGMGAIIMDGVIIHQNVILGGGTVVPPHRELEEGTLWVGNPAKKLRAITDEEYKFLRYSANYYVELKNKYTGVIPAQAGTHP